MRTNTEQINSHQTHRTLTDFQKTLWIVKQIDSSVFDYCLLEGPLWGCSVDAITHLVIYFAKEHAKLIGVHCIQLLFNYEVYGDVQIVRNYSMLLEQVQVVFQMRSYWSKSWDQSLLWQSFRRQSVNCLNCKWNRALLQEH